MPFDTPHLQLCLDKCSFCSIPSSFICAKCKKVSYCSKSHQQQHWKTHKADCFPLIIKYCEEVGRCLITTRDIQEGEIVLKEAPLISGPHFGRNSPHSGQWPICLACFREVRSTYNCSKCGWPLCGNKCENVSVIICKNNANNYNLLNSPFHRIFNTKNLNANYSRKRRSRNHPYLKEKTATFTKG